MRRYGALVAIPGARVPLIFSTLGSMPIGMFGLAILLLAYDATGSFAQAGRVAGAFSLANAFGALVQGRLMDRLGQTRVLRLAAAAHLARRASRWSSRPGGRRTVVCACALAGGFDAPAAPGRDALAVERRWATTASSGRRRTRWSRSCSRWRW